MSEPRDRSPATKAERRRRGPTHLVRDLLDRTLVDSDGTPCGVVDDVELAADGAQLAIVALWVGPRARARRLPGPVRWLLSSPSDPEVRLPWSLVARIDERIHLADTARALGLDGEEQAVARWIAKLPGA